ncbi:MAG: ABC transporter substrate-binding protein [Tepidiformaceae bacterium]
MLAATGGAVVAAVGAGAGAGWALNRGGGSNSAVPPTPTLPLGSARPATSMVAPSPASTPTPVRPRGGTARLASADSFNFDTFDAQRAGEPTVVEVLGRALSRLVQWSDFGRATLAGDLAASWEQPDEQTLVLHLDPAARWQDRAPVGGRPVTATDVVANLRRMLSLLSGQLPLTQRPSDYASIATVTSSAAGIVTVATNVPDPFLLGTLAGRFALVQAPEAVTAFESHWQDAKPEQVIGSGPFAYSGQDAGGLTFAAFRGGHRPPLLDALTVAGPTDDPAAFEAKQVDELLTRDRRDADAARQALGSQVTETSRFEDSPVISSFFVGSPPWDNPALTTALNAALNRKELASRLLGGRAAASGPVSPATPAFALDDAALAAYPGFRADYAADMRDAKQRWEAAGGPGLGTVTIDFPSIFDPRYSASSVVTGMLNDALGNQFRAAVETYTTISDKASSKKYGNGAAAFWFGWAPALALPDASRYLLETYSSDSPNGQALGLPAKRESPSRRLLTAEFDLARRAELARQVGKDVLEGGGMGVLPWLLQQSELFRWPYFHGSEPTPFWPQHLDAGAWLDASSASFSGRPL